MRVDLIRRAPPQAVTMTEHRQATAARAHGGTTANAEYDGRAHLSETAREIMRVDLIRGARPRAVAMTEHSQAKAANATWRHDGQRA